MRNIAKITLTTIAAFALSTTVMARDKVVIDMFGEQLRGTNIIKLKREIKSQHPRMNLQNKILKAVVLVAKTKHGQGEATLFVNGAQGYPSTIAGTPSRFHHNGPRSFSRTNLDMPFGAQRGSGAWQLETRGNFKIDKIIVKMENKRQPQRPPRRTALAFTHVGSFKALKLMETTKTFHNDQFDVKVLKITSEKNYSSITEVKVKFKNGQVKHLFSLEGSYSKGETRKVTFVNPRNIEKITVTAETDNLFNSRAQINVEAGKLIQRHR